MNSFEPESIIHLVDDDEAIRVAISRLLSAAGFSVRTYSCAGEFLIAFDETAAAGCLILDLHMPGPDGMALYEALKKRGFDLPTIFLTGRGDIASSVRALKAGASDFLTKPIRGEALIEAVRGALLADEQHRAQRHRKAALKARFDALNERERKVLEYVLRGMLNKQIAYELSLSERTIKSARASVMHKLEVQSLPDLARLAQESGLSPGFSAALG